MIAIVDYGVGNVQAIENIYRRLQVPVTRARTAEDLASAERLVLPGVGAFDWAMERLDASGMRATLDDLVLRQGRPVLGICVGMQMMAAASEEGRLPGLGWIDGQVKKLDETFLAKGTRLPHMGWNDVVCAKDPLFAHLETGARFYFLHSFYFAAREPGDVLATADYGGVFPCAVRRGRIRGVQFHPEKSHSWGVQLLKNFAEA